ncbi:L-threonine aldolase [Bacillus sp. OV322]|nr:L-threonine aldolase [Bacillus sp. OV322]
MMNKMFASDNNSGIHPKILKSICEANEGHAASYGGDLYTKKSLDAFKKHFGENISVYYVFNGTGANVLALKSMTRSYHSVICSSVSHINGDETGAFENFTGGKLITCPSADGKITVSGIKELLKQADSPHRSKPIAVSISQCTELGTVYTKEEIETIADFVHENGMYLHVDGARLSNAAAHLQCSLKEITAGCGVDVLSFGGTKNGLMAGEAVIFFNQHLAQDFLYIRKHGLQLASKMRFIAAQFECYLNENLWLENANHANAMAVKLAEELSAIPEFRLLHPVESNAVFAVMPDMWMNKLQEKIAFSIWNPDSSEVRWVASFDTSDDDIEKVRKAIKEISEEIS